MDVFIGHSSEIHLVEADKRQRKPNLAAYRDALKLIPYWAAQGETPARKPVKFGEASGGVIPSQALQAVFQAEKV
ncbi:MAG: hypothetical protein ACYDBA_11240 [Sulfuricaulis sp.]